jgi:hypothetical protein
MSHFRPSPRHFLKDESGVLLAEALIMLPILIWGFIALVVYWDLFRVLNVAQKASYSISDLMSRQEVVTEAFVAGQQNVLEFLTPGAEGSRMRITSMQLEEGFDDPANPLFDGNDDFCLIFSRSSDATIPAYQQSELKDLAERIPDMNDTESVIVVETWVDYSPDFDTGVLNAAPGVSDQTFYNFIVTRPRNGKRVSLDGEVHGCP